MEKQITRDSKFRHVFGKTWKKESSVINIKVKSSGSFIKGNGKYSVFPWETVGGALAIVPNDYCGKLPDQCPLIRSHQSNIVDIAFSPFNEDLLGTAARESVIKFWKVGDELINKKDQNEPLFTLGGHKNRIHLLSFHPSVDNLLLSVAADKTQKLWDIQTQSELLSFPSPDKDILSVSWFDNGKLFASSSKDKQLRIYDPRSSSSPIIETQAHEGLNGFYVQYLEMDRFITSGTTRDSRYQLAVWDIRNFSSSVDSSSPASDSPFSPIRTNTYTPYPTLYFPYYDPGTGLCYLISRGDSILVYEVNNNEPLTHSINRITTPNYSSCFMLPKRLMDVRESEVSRFRLLCKQSVETVSIYVPRKTASTIFQEDIYPPVASTVASNTTTNWINGSDTEIDLISLKPDQMASIFEIDEEKGGKSKEIERIKRLERSGSASLLSNSNNNNEPVILPTPELVNGYVDHHLGGWSTPWAKRYMLLEEDESLQFYKDDLSLQMIFSILLSDIKSVSHDERLVDQFVIQAKKQYRFKVESSEMATRWVQSIQTAKSNYDHPSRVQQRTTSSVAASSAENSPSSPLISNNNNNVVISGDREGFLETLVTGTVYTGTSNWVRRFYVIEGKMLYSYSSNRKMHQHPLEKISLSKITAVIKSSSSSSSPDSKPFTIKVLTQNQVLYLAAENEEEQNQWVQSLLIASPLGKQLAFNEEDTSSYVLNSAMEGFLQRNVTSNNSNPQNNNNNNQNKLGGWERVWVSSAGLYLLYFSSEYATTPLDKFTIKNIKHVSVVDQSLTDFIIQFTDGKMIRHRALNSNERNDWVDKLDFLRKQFVDIFDVFRISDREVESQDAIKRIEANVIDPIEVKNGNCPLLIQIKGRKRIRVAMVECKYTSLSKKSCFVLDAGKALYQWNGSSSARVTRAKAVDLANKIRMKERGGLSQVFVLDEGVNDDNPVFWRILSGNKANVPNSSADDEEDHPVSTKIYRIYDNTVQRSKRIQLIHDSMKLPPKEYLDSKSTSVVDCNTELFVWIGSQSKAYQRRLAMLLAKKLTQESHREKWTSITRIVENGETILFKEKFSNYPGMLPINVSKQTSKGKIAQTGEQEVIDVLQLHHNRRKDGDDHSFGHSGFIKQIWRIDGFEKSVVAADRWGHFYQSDSYIILYQYFVEGVGKDLFVLFYWQGIDSSRNEKGTSAYITVGISDELSNADQERVVQGKEPDYFLRLFHPKLNNPPPPPHPPPQQNISYVVHHGKDDHNLSADMMIEKMINESALFSVFGDDELNCYPTQVELSSSSLHSCCSFVLLSPNHVYLWIGSFSSPLHLSVARHFASSFRREIKEVKEGEEKNEFWELLGGKKEYFSSKQAIKAGNGHRFFLVSNASGVVRVSEVTNYGQEDLNDDHCAILDFFSELYVWFGGSSSDLERQLAMETAIEYVKQSPVGHSPDTPIYVCQSYAEPKSFINQFRCWTTAHYHANKKNMIASVQPVEEVLQRFTTVTYSYEELLSDTLPPAVNPTKLEQYLSNEEFEKVFKMTRSEYMKLPMWQADKLKQEVNLF